MSRRLGTIPEPQIRSNKATNKLEQIRKVIGLVNSDAGLSRILETTGLIKITQTTSDELFC